MLKFFCSSFHRIRQTKRGFQIRPCRFFRTPVQHNTHVLQLAMLPAWIAYAVACGTAATGAWVVAHECGHGAFSDNRTLQDAVGYVLHVSTSCVRAKCIVLVFVPILLHNRGFATRPVGFLAEEAFFVDAEFAVGC